MTAAWSLVITKRDGTAVHTFTADDAITTGPIKGFDGQDTGNDIGIAHITVPAEHAVNDHLTEDNLAHLYVRGSYATTFIIRVPQITVIDPGDNTDSELAVYELAHLLGICEEGIVEPPAGTGSKPAASDRIFDWSDPARVNSDFTTPDELGTLDDATLNYLVKPYGFGITNRSTVKVIGPAGYSWGDDAPDGRSYFYIDHDFGAGAFFIFRGVGDNGVELRMDGKTIQPFTIGFGQAFEIPKIEISGSHRIAAVVENNTGPQTFALEVLEVDAGDNVIGLELYTSNAWGISEYPGAPPGFTIGEILLTVLGEEQALGVLTDVTCSFDGTNDSNGDPWAETVAVSTKSLTPLEQFFVKELTDSLIDIDAHWDGDSIVLDAWNKGGGRTASGITLAEGGNLGSLKIANARRAMSTAAVIWNNGGDLTFGVVSELPVAGHPARRRPLSLGGARDTGQVTRDASSQIGLFNRSRQKIAVTHISNADTPDGELPPSYWKWSTIDLSVTSRWISSGTFELVAVTFQLADGLLVFKPEAGDLIIPTPVLAADVLRKMAPPSLAGRSLVASPASPSR